MLMVVGGDTSLPQATARQMNADRTNSRIVVSFFIVTLFLSFGMPFANLMESKQD